MELAMEDTMIRIAYDGMQHSLIECTKSLDLSTIKEVVVKIEFEDGQCKRARTCGKDMVELIRKHQELLECLYEARKKPRLTLVDKIRYIFTGKS